LKFVIRDDDPCAITRPDELEACWGSVWGEIPVCLSVTPFRVPGREGKTAEVIEEGNEPIPLEENRELVAYLRDLIAAGRVHIAMHGYHHTTPGGLPEYVAAGDLRDKTLHGREYLERLLGCEVSTFVPPNNGLGLKGFAAVIGAKMNIVNNQPYGRLLGIPSSPVAAADFLIGAQYALRQRLGWRSLFSVNAYCQFKQVPYQTVGPSTNVAALKDAFELCRLENGIFVMATHYHSFERKLETGERVAEIVNGLLEAGRAAGDVEFQTYDQIWSGAGR